MKKINIKKWQKNKNIKYIFDILEEKNEETRFVGGCLRNLILNKDSDDIDLATTLIPNEVLNRLIKKKIKVIKSGISHGTIIAILNKKKIEITTLREDIKTDGRHAKVKFTDDWITDSNRRDFTINALSCNFDGDLFDYHNGLKDLKNGNIKFIGSAEERIREDFLRILRFFRFYSFYGKAKIKNSYIKIFKKTSSNIKKLSSERIYSEFKKILIANNSYEVLNLMKITKVLKNIIFDNSDLKRLKNLEFIPSLKTEADFSIILSIIIKEKNLFKIFKKLNLSNLEKKKVKNIIFYQKKINFKEIEHNINKYIYICGKDLFIGLLIYDFAKYPIKNKIKKYINLLNLIKKSKIPKFPLAGKDVIKLGIKTGPSVGKILKLVENWWLENKTKPIRKDCLKKLKEFC